MYEQVSGQMNKSAPGDDNSSYFVFGFFLRTYSEPHIFLSALSGISHLILTTVLIENSHYYYFFSKSKETEVQRR